MAENDDVPGEPDSQPTTEQPVTQQSADTPPPAAGPVLVTRWRDRAWSFRAMIGVALASLLIGGLAGGAVVAASDDGHDRGRIRMMRMGPDGEMGPPGWRGRGPREFRGDGGPRWRWGEGPQDDQDQQPPTPPTPSPSE